MAPGGLQDVQTLLLAWPGEGKIFSWKIIHINILNEAIDEEEYTVRQGAMQHEIKVTKKRREFITILYDFWIEFWPGN